MTKRMSTYIRQMCMDTQSDRPRKTYGAQISNIIKKGQVKITEAV